MPNAHIPQCQYIRTDGRQCGSPRLKTKRYCYFHYEVNRSVAYLDIPPLEDGNAIQLALTDLARAIVEERIALKPAALLAYILQTASANLKRVQLGVFTDRMITELPDLDPYARGLAPGPGERNRDPERAAVKALVPSERHALDPSEGHDFSACPERSRTGAKTAAAPAPSTLPKAPASAPEGRPRIAQGVSPGRGDDEKIPTALPTAGAQVAGATAAPKKATSAPIKSHELTRKIGSAKAGSLKDAKALLGLLKDAG